MNELKLRAARETMAERGNRKKYEEFKEKHGRPRKKIDWIESLGFDVLTFKACTDELLDHCTEKYPNADMRKLSGAPGVMYEAFAFGYAMRMREEELLEEGLNELRGMASGPEAA